MLASAAAFAEAVEMLAQPFVDSAVIVFAGIEARGLLFGPPIAQRLGVGFVPLRKPGRLPSEVLGMDYDLEYGSDRLELHADALDAESRVLLVDDVLATGGTMTAAIDLVALTGASVVGASVLIDLVALGGAAKIGSSGPTVLHSVLEVN